MNTRKLVAVLGLLAVSMLSACTPEELITSHNAQEPCAFINGVWSSDNCAAVEHDQYVFVRPEDERPVPLSPEETQDLLDQMAHWFD